MRKILMLLMLVSCQKELSSPHQSTSSTKAEVSNFSVSRIDGGYFIKFDISHAEGNNMWLEAIGDGKKWTWPVDKSGSQTYTLIGFDNTFTFDVVPVILHRQYIPRE